MSQMAEELYTLLNKPGIESRLDKETRGALANWLAQASAEQAAAAAALAEQILEQQGGHQGALFLRALLAEEAGENEQAGNLYLQLAQQAAQREDWEAVVDLCQRAMPLTGDYRLLRLVRQAAAAGVDAQAALELAYEECADSPDLLWERSQEAGREGRPKEALALALAALEGYVAIREPVHAEDPLLRVLEAEDRETYVRLLRILRRMANAGQNELIATALELAEERFFALELAEPLAETLAYILERRPELSRFRELYARAVVAPIPHRENLGEAIAEAGLANPDVPLADALAAFRTLAAFSPGAYVWHRSWGVGRIRRRQEDEIFIDFEERPGHRMALSLAQQVLTPLPPDSLLVRRAVDPEALRCEAYERPAEIIWQLLREAGGELTTKELKARLTAWLIPEEEWADWWRQARQAIQDDPRFDCAEAFRHLYRLARLEADTEIVLPPLDRRKGLKGAVSLIQRLLAQHPELTGRVRAAYGAELCRWLEQTTRAEQRLRALPLLARLYPERREEWQALAEQALKEAPLTNATTEEDQRLLLEWGLETDAWLETALGALASRFASIRDQARQILQAREDEGLWLEIETLLLDRGRHSEKIAVAEAILQGELRRRDDPPDALAVRPWLLLRAVLSVVADPEARSGLGAAQRLLRPGGPLAAWLEKDPLDAQAEGWLRLFQRRGIRGEIEEQLAAFFDAIGRPELKEALLAKYQATAREKSELWPEFDPRVTLMTRATLEAQQERLRELAHQLAVEIPQEIARARAFGDLSENAEYHAARERQGITKALYDKLAAQLEIAQAIEDLPLREGIVSVGKRVRLRHSVTGEEQEIWILGEGDSRYGPNVVSYRAPLAQALIGKRVGERAQLNEEDASYEIMAIISQLPEEEDQHKACDASRNDDINGVDQCTGCMGADKSAAE